MEITNPFAEPSEEDKARHKLMEQEQIRNSRIASVSMALHTYGEFGADAMTAKLYEDSAVISTKLRKLVESIPEDL